QPNGPCRHHRLPLPPSHSSTPPVPPLLIRILLGFHHQISFVKHGKAKDVSSIRSLEYLSMEKQAQGISDGMYIYRHRREGGVEIHDIFVKKSTTRLLLSWVGAILLLANVCCTLLSKESLCLGSLWSISFSGIIAKCLRYDPVKKESLVIMPTFGVQLEQHLWSGRVYRKFVPIGKILKPVLNEHVTPVTCYWSLALLLCDEYELMVVFKRLHPPVKMLVPIWGALFALTNSDGTSIVCQPQDSHGLV
ncbi:hypothetical protein EJB05_31329, partial [Eragrostis curvula]